MVDSIALQFYELFFFGFNEYSQLAYARPMPMPMPAMMGHLRRPRNNKDAIVPNSTPPPEILDESLVNAIQSKKILRIIKYPCLFIQSVSVITS